EVDDEERKDDAVPERVDDAADLEEPDIMRQLRVEAAEETHRRNLAGRVKRRRSAEGRRPRGDPEVRDEDAEPRQRRERGRRQGCRRMPLPSMYLPGCCGLLPRERRSPGTTLPRSPRPSSSPRLRCRSAGRSAERERRGSARARPAAASATGSPALPTWTSWMRSRRSASSTAPGSSSIADVSGRERPDEPDQAGTPSLPIPRLAQCRNTKWGCTCREPPSSRGMPSLSCTQTTHYSDGSWSAKAGSTGGLRTTRSSIGQWGGRSSPTS